MCKKFIFGELWIPHGDRLITMLSAAGRAVVLALLCSLPVTRVSAQVCTLCPANATDTAIGTAFGVAVVRNGVSVNLASGAAVGACETLVFSENVQYAAVGNNGGVGAGFSGGAGNLFLTRRGGVTVHELVANVTPADMNTTLVGPASCPGAVTAKPMNTSSYTITAADVASGFLQFTFEYTNGLAALPNPVTGECLDHVEASPQRNITVVAGPTCSIAPSTLTVCEGTQASFTASGTGQAPLTFTWVGPNGFTGAGATITIASAQAADAGTYTATVTDAFGCTSTCTATLIVNPNPTCTISPAGPVNCNSTTTFTSTVSPAGGTVTHSWTISGNGTINGAANGASVSVTAGASGSFTLTDAITVDGCPGQCSLTVNITPCPPAIRVHKQVVCLEGPGVCGTFGPGLDTDNKSASGVKGATCPAFCYRITVENTGQVDLTGVVVSDSRLSLASCGFPSTLAVGQTVQCVVPAVEICDLGNTVNTVTAEGQSASDSSAGGHVSDTSSATVTVVPISVACDIILHSEFDQDANNGGADGSPNDNHVTLPDSASVQLSLTVRNTGQADLTVAVSGLPCSVDINGNPIPATVTVAAGASSDPIICDFDVTCPSGANLTVTVVGTAVASVAFPCVFNSQGVAITTAPSTCSASVNCVSPVTCRVTGGGTLIAGTVDQSCVPVETTIFDALNASPVIKITHGGQLGAPFSQMDCGAILGNPCIRGQWQHTRHYVGKGNPRDVIDMNFHSVTPKGQFDSLSCACLGCCDPETGVFIPPTTGPLIHKFALCNPDDHKVCGPEPRPAPANAIIFSGVGKITPTDDVAGGRAAQAEWVVFRVYIEDRSEPGGFHPKGAIEPSDIYCFQAWKTGIKVSKKPDFSTVDPAFRTALGDANCQFLAGLEGGGTPIGSLPSPIVSGRTADIQDCGPLHDGNQQIHPSTGATCTQ